MTDKTPNKKQDKMKYSANLRHSLQSLRSDYPPMEMQFERLTLINIVYSNIMRI